MTTSYFFTHVAAGLVGAIVLGSVLATPVQAAPMVFTDEASFTAAITAVGLSLQHDDFEGLPEGFVAGDLDRGSYVASALGALPGLNLFVNQQAANFTDGDTVLIATPFPQPLQLRFDAPVRAFSVDLLDLVAFAPADLLLGVDGAAPVAVHQLSAYPGPRTTFFGVVDADAFSSLVLTTEYRGYPGLTSSTLTMDRLQHEAAPVPEPATLGLLAIGLLGAGRAARRRGRG